MTSLHLAARTVLTAVLSVGLVLGMTAFIAPASAASTTTSTTSEQCLDARHEASVARQASVAAAKQVAAAKKKVVRSGKKLTKTKKKLARTKKAVRAGKAVPRAQKKARRVVKRTKRLVKRNRAALRARERVATVRRGAAARAVAASVAACQSEPATKAEATAEVEESIAVVEEMSRGDDPVYALLPAELIAPLQETLGQVLVQLVELESLIPAAGPAELEQILGQLAALDPARFANALGDLEETLTGIGGGGTLPGGPAELVVLLEALLGQLGAPAGLPPGADLTVLTDLLDEVFGAIQGFDPTGHSAPLDQLAAQLGELTGVLEGGEEQLTGVVGLLGALGGGELDAAAVQGLLGSLVGALGGGALPGVGDLPFAVPSDAAGADQVAVLLATLTGLLGGDALPADVFTGLVEDILGGIPGLPPLDELPVLGPILGPIVCGLPVLCG